MVPPLDRIPTNEGFTEPYLPGAVTLAGVAVGLRTLAKGVTPDSGGRGRPCPNYYYYYYYYIIIIIIIIVIIIPFVC